MLRSGVFRGLLTCELPNLSKQNFLPKYYSASASAAQKTNHQTVEYENAKPYNTIPGPKPLPIVGNAWRFMGGIDFLKICKEMHNKYGDIVKMRELLAFGDMTFLFNTRDIEYMLRNEGQWPSREALPSMMYYRHVLRRDVYGDTHGLVNGQDEKWGTFRTAVNPIMMQPRVTHQYIPQINEIADEFIGLVKNLKTKDPNGEMPANFIDQMNKWAFESITAIALDTRLGVLAEKPSERAETAMNYMLEIFRLSLKLDILITGKYHRKYNTPTWRKFVKYQDFFTTMVMDLINDAKTKIDNDPDYAKKSENDKSVFEKLIVKDKQIAIVMILDMLGAGIDTTSRVGGATLYYLARNPEAQANLRAELKRLMPKKDTVITKEILDEAKYLRACIKEALRFAPISFGNIRIMTKDIVLAGYQIPTGSVVNLPNLYLSKVVDTHFSNPSAYIPERWLRDVKTEHVNAFVSLPFGFGARSCIGKRMANMEIEVLVAKMVRNFMMEWKHKDMAFKQEMLYGMADPLKIRLSDVTD